MTRPHQPQKPEQTAPVPKNREEWCAAIDGLINNRIIGRAFSNFVLRCLYEAKNADPTRLIHFSRHLMYCHDAWMQKWLEGGRVQ